MGGGSRARTGVRARCGWGGRDGWRGMCDEGVAVVSAGSGIRQAVWRRLMRVPEHAKGHSHRIAIAARRSSYGEGVYAVRAGVGRSTLGGRCGAMGHGPWEGRVGMRACHLRVLREVTRSLSTTRWGLYPRRELAQAAATSEPRSLLGGPAPPMRASSCFATAATNAPGNTTTGDRVGDGDCF